MSLQIVASIASIISVPLAIWFFYAAKELKDLKARQEISDIIYYGLRPNKRLRLSVVNSIFEKELIKQNIKHPSFTKRDIINDVITKVFRNPLGHVPTTDKAIENLHNVLDELNDEENRL